MTTDQATALYRAEKALAEKRGTDLTTEQPIPERHHSRRKAWEIVDGIPHMRNDAFVVHRPGPR